MSDISLAAINRLIKQIDPDMRVAKASKEELRTSIEEYAIRIAELAVAMAQTAHRTTVLQQDIVTAREQLLKGMVFHQTQLPP